MFSFFLSKIIFLIVTTVYWVEGFTLDWRFDPNFNHSTLVVPAVEISVPGSNQLQTFFSNNGGNITATITSGDPNPWRVAQHSKAWLVLIK